MKPFQQGKQARREWQSVDCNPFNIVCETDEHLEWLSGWKTEDKKLHDRAGRVFLIVLLLGLAGVAYVVFK